MMKLRLRFKNLLCHIGFGDWLIEYCGRCGIRQPFVWCCQNDVLYKFVMGHIDYLLCPNCFNREAERHGIFLRWYPRDESEHAGTTGIPKERINS